MADTQEAAKLLCTLCGLLHDPSAGRLHGTRFGCHSCLAADKQLRRGLGSKAELQSLEPEEQRKFFQRLQQEKKQQQGKAIPWVTVRAELVTTLCTKQVTSNEGEDRKLAIDSMACPRLGKRHCLTLPC